MDQATWNSLTPQERESQRSDAGLTHQLIGLEGWRVEVTDHPGDKPRRFIVGRSTGWVPCHLEIARRNCHGGGAARNSYATVKRLYRVR